MGIASFGPVDLQPRSPTYGFITSTPKPGWANVDIVGAARAALELPVGFDTDVNAAGLAEWRWGAARGLDSVLYLTVGTGIGGGGLMDGRLLHGLVHPEMGHIRIPHDLERGSVPGRVPVPRRLPRGAGERSRDEGPMAAGCRGSARRPPGVAPRSPVPRARGRELRLHAVAAAHRDGWRGHVAPAAARTDTRAGSGSAEQLRARARN